MAEQQGGAAGGQMSAREEDAYGLSEAAVMLDQARGDQGALASALDHNVEVWVAIRTLVSRDDNTLPAETRDNLVKLSKFVTDTTLSQGVTMPAQVLDTLINVNLQIAEGLLEGAGA